MIKTAEALSGLHGPTCMEASRMEYTDSELLLATEDRRLPYQGPENITGA